MIYIGADHGGFELKQHILIWLTEWGMSYEDLGAHQFDAADDYPQFAFGVAEKVAVIPAEHRGILACRSAAGVIIAANKVKGIRAVAVSDVKSAQHSREHNDANVIGLSGDWMTTEQAKETLKVWLTTPFSDDERHLRRIQQISAKEATL